MVVRLYIFLLILVVSTCSHAQRFIRLQLRHTWGHIPIEVSNTPVNKAQFYVHNFSISQLGKTLLYIPQPQLFTALSDSLFSTTFFITDTAELEIAFTIGLPDSVLQNGIGEGVLDPLNGMFWTWQTGYVFVKCEASVHQQKYSYHIGGMAPSPDARRTFTAQLKLPAGAQNIQWVVNWEQLVTPIQNNPIPVTCHAPGPLAMLLADRFLQAHSFVIL
jgi:hypothetical protein